MQKLVLLGSGTLSKHLCLAFSRTQGVDLVQVVGRNREALEEFPPELPKTDDFGAIAEADLYLLAVSDDAIAEVSRALSGRSGVVAHTSGTVGLSELQTPNRGVFYPLQTFSRGREVDFGEIPLCIEAERPESLELLRKLAGTLTEKVHAINSEQRKKLHLAAVFVNNFTNYLYGVGQELCQAEGLSFDLLKPLILETARKVQQLPPREAQSGPAKRGDQGTIERHLELLSEEAHKALYILLSESIKIAHEKKL